MFYKEKNVKRNELMNEDKNVENINELIYLINDLLLNYTFVESDEKFIKEIENLKNKIKYYINNNSFLNSFFNKLKQYINSSSLDIFKKINSLSLMNKIIEIDSMKFMNHIDYILAIYQYFLTEEYSQLSPKISQNFGDLIKLQLYQLNNLSEQHPQKNYNNTILLLVYNKYKSFCINNIKSSSIYCKIYGTLCLTAFIENCSFIYNTNDKLKEIYDILIEQLDNKNNIGKLEILNCFTSLIFCSETRYISFAKCTVRKIINLCSDQEWIIKKFALNILCTLMYYFQEEIFSLKDIIINKLKYLKNENSPEIKEIIEQINTFFLIKDKNNNNENELSELHYIKTEETNPKINKNNSKNYNGNYLITEPINLNNKKEKKKIMNNIKNNILFPNLPKKNKSKIVNKKDNRISRSKSYGQKNIMQLKSGVIKKKFKDKKMSYYNIYKVLGNNEKINFKIKYKNERIANNNVNNSKIPFNNSFFFIKNNSLIFKPYFIKKEKNNNYNLSFSLKDKKFNVNDKNKKIVLNLINNQYSSKKNNNDFNSYRKINQHECFISKIQRNNIEKIKKTILKENISMNNVNKNSISTKLLKQTHSKIFKKYQYNKLKQKSKSKSSEKNNNKFNDNKAKELYLNKNINIINKRNNLRPEYKVCITSLNKSLMDETFNSTRKSSCNSKNHKKKEKKIIMKFIPLKKINCNKTKKNKEYIHNNSKEKISNNYIDSISLQNEKGIKINRTIINKKKLKLLGLKTLKHSKNKLNKYSHKSNSISINNKNNIINELNLNLNDITNRKACYNLQNEFNEYKKNTNKIINELRSKVDELQKTIIMHDKEKIKEFIKEKDFSNAFNLALKLDIVEEIYYILKEYNTYINENKINKSELNSDLLDKIINFLCNNINSFKNINVVIFFILYNIAEKKRKISEDSCKLIYETLIYLYNNRKKSFLSKLDINNIKYLIDYFKIK